MMKEQMNENALALDWRWHALKSKNKEFDGLFFFAVRTTGVFCRPSCSSRTPKLQNVTFYATTVEAIAAGFRACLRCKPESSYFPGAAASLIVKAFEILRDEDGEIATIRELSDRLSVSSGYLQRIFNSVLGLSPKKAFNMLRIEKFRHKVRRSDVATSLYESGFGSSRALYEKAGETLGMTPARYKKGGKDMNINYTISDSKLGKLLVAATEKGICSVSFGESEEKLKEELTKEFFAASFQKNETILKEAVATILHSLDGENNILTLPLDVRSTVFQMRVWTELRRIPYGETRSYGHIAESMGNSKSVRAVARACATNPVALVTPCHRVIAADGKLSGFRWGIERKKQLLKEEKDNAVLQSETFTLSSP
jgi:AraC family transcriptional regulator of adaptative response/methylated-DNA-[protein]-cysteine methyltransferase